MLLLECSNLSQGSIDQVYQDSNKKKKLAKKSLRLILTAGGSNDTITVTHCAFHDHEVLCIGIIQNSEYTAPSLVFPEEDG